MFLREGDFFDGEIPSADLYILARIIHDWKVDKNIKLLKKIYSACNKGETKGGKDGWKSAGLYL